MKVYKTLSNIKYLKDSYTLKVLSITFVGIHVPLIGIIVYTSFGTHTLSTWSIILLTLLFTLVATGIALLILKKLLLPVHLANKALADYIANRTIPNLPTEYTDEIGVLMKNIQHTTLKIENLLTEKKDFIYLLTHDLRNYIAGAQSMAQLIIAEKPKEPILEYAQHIKTVTLQQQKFINLIITQMKLGNGLDAPMLPTELIGISSVIEEACNNLKINIEKKNIKITVTQEDKLLVVVFEKDLLAHILVNLLQNAIKFSQPDTEINIVAKAANNHIYISVIDKGIGFDEALSKQLFGQFKASRVGTAGEPSLGMGLYLCKNIVERNGGTITAQSAGKDKGSTFTIVLPQTELPK
ncbi:Signal transduction histidine kinase [Flexibacter flexilis DSM 6793]|uniref:histidine kinase n=1 Tax=Flexibacter flexilis DSM 6793 TaxID=927664 RepID=A0A1I1KGN8_9BACT|nr:HAMP domain-containing sensor histidine kinase [Flexibacter flexilis]SFC59989.1 Signal transduction histidine kinase [Flexibacter flexilis DSM 6793]